MAAAPKPVSPAEAKEVWDALPRPSARKVAEKFAAAGRKISHKTVNQWRNAGWKRGSEPQAPIEKAMEAADVAAPAITGDPNTKASDLPQPPALRPMPALDDQRANAELIELACKEALHTARVLFFNVEANPVLPLAAPEGTAKLVQAASALIESATETLKQLPALREAGAVTVNGQEILPPKPVDPLQASFDAFRRAREERQEQT